MPSRGGAGLRPHSRLGVREERGSVESDLSGRSGRKFLPGQVLRVLSDAPGLRLLRQKVSFALRQRSLLPGFRLHTPLN